AGARARAGRPRDAAADGRTGRGGHGRADQPDVAEPDEEQARPGLDGADEHGRGHRRLQRLPRLEQAQLDPDRRDQPHRHGRRAHCRPAPQGAPPATAAGARGAPPTTAAPRVYDIGPPPLPQNVAAAATPTNQKPVLTWASGGSDALSGFAHYEVWRGTTLVG